MKGLDAKTGNKSPVINRIPTWEKVTAEPSKLTGGHQNRHVKPFLGKVVDTSHPKRKQSTLMPMVKSAKKERGQIIDPLYSAVQLGRSLPFMVGSVPSF